jgi:cyclohexanone monooxygenase
LAVKKAPCCVPRHSEETRTQLRHLGSHGGICGPARSPCFHNEYLETFNRENVTLVDTDGKGVERITRRGVMIGGREYELDCLIFATGFEVGTDYCRRAGMRIFGRRGLALTDWWSEGIRTLHGMHVEGFPNCFIMTNAQAGFTANYPHLLNEQAKYLSYIVRRAMDDGLATVEATEEGVRQWAERCIEKADMARDFFESCTPGYYNNEGKLSERSVQNGFYGGGAGSPEFFSILEAWRTEGTMKGLTTR